MIAHVPVRSESVVSDEDFYERFVELRLKLKTLGAEIISVHHSNHWVDVDWLPQGASRNDEPSRSTLFRLVPESEPGETNDLMFIPGGVDAAVGLAI
ncbi:MAG TPA: hypothetical protein VEZ24_12660 [Microvirga sp.]|nr:hypothetical protein [Microvirga sp.]